MVTIEDNAWILHKKPSGDTSLYITFFTEKHGVIPALYKGGNRPKKQSILQQLNAVWVCFSEKSGRYYANKVEFVGPSLNLAKDSLFASLYINELLYYLLKPLDYHSELYASYTNILQKLQLTTDKKDLEILLRKFEIQLLNVVGYGLTFDYEANTGAQILAKKVYRFVPELGFVSAQLGILGEHIHAMANADYTNPVTLKLAKNIMRTAIDHCLSGRVLKTRSLYKTN